MARPVVDGKHKTWTARRYRSPPACPCPPKPVGSVAIANPNRRAQRADAIHELDLQYQHTSHQAELLVKDEEVRRLRVRNTLSRDDNTAIKEQLAQRDERIRSEAAKCVQVQSQLQHVKRTAEQQEKHMRVQAREMAKLKVSHPPSQSCPVQAVR